MVHGAQHNVTDTQIIPAATKEVSLQSRLEPRAVPQLSTEDLKTAMTLSEQLDRTKPQQVLLFGDSVQGKVAQFSESLLGNTSIGESGKVGELLMDLKGKIEQIDPNDLKGAQSLWGKFVALLPGAATVQDRINMIVTKHEQVKPALDKIGSDLGLEQARVGITIEQLEELEGENKSYVSSLRIVKAALIIAYNKGAGDYEQARKQVGNSDDVLEIGEVRKDWENLQRMDRRLYAVEASLALAHTNDAQIGRLREILMYNAETLAEAQHVMLPAWRTNIALAITALQAKDQVALVETFRTMTDNLLTNTGNLLVDIEGHQATMQQRTFVSAEVIAKVNQQIATNIESVLARQVEAKKSREEGIKLIAESQSLVLKAMRDSGEKLLETNSLDLSASPKVYDLSASLLQQPKAEEARLHSSI